MGVVESVEWPTLKSWLETLALMERARRWDAIVGISRGGAALAIPLSYLLPALPLHFAYFSGIKNIGKEFYVFDAGREHRLQWTRSHLQLTTPFESRRPLIVDDVATFGDTLGTVRDLVLESGPEDVSFALYAVDPNVLRRERPELLAKAIYAREVDNSVTWLSFPWQSS